MEWKRDIPTVDTETVDAEAESCGSHLLMSVFISLSAVRLLYVTLEKMAVARCYYYQPKLLRWHRMKRLPGHLTMSDSVTVHCQENYDGTVLSSAQHSPEDYCNLKAARPCASRSAL